MDTLVPSGMPDMPGMAPAAPHKKRNWLMIVGIAIVAFIAFVGLIIGCVFSMGGPAMKAGEDFLKQLSSNQVDKAYESAAIDFKQNVPKDAFTAFLKDYPIATKISIVSFNSFKIENSIYATLEGTVTATDGQVAPVNMRLVNENGTWRVIYVDFMTPEEKAKAEKAAQEYAAQQQAAKQGGAQGTQQQPPPGTPQPTTGEPVTAPAGTPTPATTPAAAPGTPAPTTTPTTAPGTPQ